MLSTYGSTVMPRVVYAQFQGEGGAIYGTYMDDIVYDPVAPEDSVSILGGETSTVTLWLEAWDDNSGVDRMQAAAGLDGIGITAWQPYINTLEWMLTGDVVYAQFKDRAGNVSSIYDSNGNEWEAVFRVFLPLVVRSH